MKRENSNKGFTLVELIVVIVILAILAAILVPALLGYIDRAKGSQIILNAKSCYTAAQAEASTAYATAKSGDALSTKLGTNEKNRIMTTADVPNCTALYIAPADNTAGLDHAKWTVKYVYYAEGTSGEFFDGEKWVDDTEGDVSKITLPTGVTKIDWITIK